MKDYIGYSLLRTAAIHGGHSSAQLVQPKAAVIGNGNDPIGISSTRALRDPGGNGILKMSSGGCDLELPGLWFSQRRKERGASLKPQAASFKLQAASDKLQDLRAAEKFHGP